MASEISISKVLLLLKEGHAMRLTYVRGTGRTKGSPKKYHVIHGHAYESFAERSEIQTVIAKSDKTPKHKMNGTIPLIDIGSKPHRQLTFKIKDIIGYNNKTIKH